MKRKLYFKMFTKDEVDEWHVERKTGVVQRRASELVRGREKNFVFQEKFCHLVLE